MIKFILGIAVGIAIGTVGLSGVVKIIDSELEQTKSIIQQSAQ